jgi:hypothetical protein
MMQFTFFCHQSSPQQVRSYLAENGAVVEGGGDEWTASVYTGGGFMSRKKWLRFTYDKEYSSAPHFPSELQAMTSYVLQFQMTRELRRQVLALIPRFEFAIGVVLEPDDVVSGDERVGIIQGVASHLGCVVLSPGALRDPSLRIFAAEDGSIEDDAEIPWGRRGPPAASELGPDEAQEDDVVATELAPPTAERVLRRLYALVAVAARGLYDMNVTAGRRPAYSLDALVRWTQELALDGELEPAERRLLAVPEGELPERAIIDSVWCIEGGAMLAWALELAPWPAYDAQIDVDDLLAAVGFLDVSQCRKALAKPCLRAQPELTRCSAQMLAYHWRMVDFRVRPEHKNFGEISIFGGPFDLTWATIANGDLALRGAALAAADSQLVSTCSSISLERFKAANWLTGHAATYSETPTDT